MATTAFTVNQIFLTAILIYILPSILMVVLSLLLKPRVNRTVNIIVRFVYMITIIVSCIGQTWVFYLLGSLTEVTLLVIIPEPPGNGRHRRPHLRCHGW
jgi:hypothetical protein